MARTPGGGTLPRGAAVLALLGGVALLAALLAVAAWRLGRSPAAEEALADTRPSASVAATLHAGDERGFARVLVPRPFVFPADHGVHPAFRNEWWYYTGNLVARDGRRFGFQLTFFRSALAPPPAAPAGTGAGAARTSAWATRQVWFAHFAVTDAGGGRFLAYERWERQALGLAGAQASPFRVWVGPWSAVAAGAEVAGTAPMRLVAAAGTAPSGSAAAAGTAPIGSAAAASRASSGSAAAAGAPADEAAGAAIDLVLTSALPPVPEGDRGLSTKSAEPGNASYYYSLPRLAAAGTLRLGAESIAVRGLAWMDREWSTSALAAGEVGWDWFALQLDDGWELMIDRLRRRAAMPGLADPGLADPASLATLIAPDGRTTLLPLAATRFADTGAWTSPAGRVRYPSGWHLTLPGAPGAATNLDLAVEPLLADQELRLSFRYWEGAVAARGTHAGRPVTARGYVELTGYGD